MKIYPSILLLSTTILLILYSISNIILSLISLNSPMPSSEFDAMHNVAMGLYSLLILVFSLNIAATSIFILKLKKWAYILNFILLFFTLLLLGISDLKEISIQTSISSEISITKEVIPIFILILLLINFKHFWFKKRAIH
ncbi:MAG: hypothetical protein HY951_02120 [Bacteroidia bacterium]|nr:hypothetical protein [Bacteroidia bacterium]